MGKEFVVELFAAANYNDPAVWQDVIGCVPSPDSQVRRELHPVRVIVSGAAMDSGDGEGGGGKEADFAVAGVVATGLDEGAVGVDGAGGAPDVRPDGEGTEGVGGGVVEDGVGGAVELDGFVIAAAGFSGGEGEVGGAEVCPVEDDDLVVVEELHVHGGDADGFLE